MIPADWLLLRAVSSGKKLINLEVIIAVQVISAVQVYLEGSLGSSLSRAIFHLLSLSISFYPLQPV